MHIVVCIKQVPDTEQLSKIRSDPKKNTIIRDKINSIVNPFDENTALLPQGITEAMVSKNGKSRSYKKI